MSESNVLIHRVRLKNYRSIAGCDVTLGRLNFLVGPNGAGKSNFVDALRLTAESLTGPLDQALQVRGGINEVRRRSGGHPTHFGVRLDYCLPDSTGGFYAFEIGARAAGAYVVLHEECKIGGNRFLVREGKLVVPEAGAYPPVSSDRLYLVNAAGLPQYRGVYDALSHMGFYNVNPDAIRELQKPDPGSLLRRDGGNLAAVVSRLEQAGEDLKARVAQYLERVVPGVTDVHSKPVGHMQTLEFRHRVQGAADPWRFPAINMSDGTLRALAILVALFQPGNGRRVGLVGLEEPETSLHPAAAGVLRDCIAEAARQVQVVVTSHSAELLDDPSIGSDQILAVEAVDGRTRIGKLDEATRSALHDRLYTAGELLRANQLMPDPGSVQEMNQLDLFEDVSS